MKARKLKLGINMVNEWVYRAYQNRGQGPTTHRDLFLSRYSHLCIYWLLIKNFITLFSGTMKTRKLKLGIIMDIGWMYRANRNRSQGAITLGVMFLSRFSHSCIYWLLMKHFRNTFLVNYENQKS